MTTSYDKKRFELADELKKCVEMARELLDQNISGYELMKDGYALELYESVKAAYDAV